MTSLPSTPLGMFAGLLDRSIAEIAALAADGRAYDPVRIGRIADIWDNNTFPLVSAAGAVWPLKSSRARTGLFWMSDLGAERRDLMVDLDPALDALLPVAEPRVHLDHQGRVAPTSIAITGDTATDLDADYDLGRSGVESLTIRPERDGLAVALTLAAPRRFIPATGRVAPDGSIEPWPDACLRFTFGGVTDVRFDADDRTGATITRDDAGCVMTIGRGGRIRAATGSVYPDDPRWYESAMGTAAARTPVVRTRSRRSVPTAMLTLQQRAAASALVRLMVNVRLVYYYPRVAAAVPLGEICRIVADAGSAILDASGHHGSARRRRFAELAARWERVFDEHAPTPVTIASGPAVLRFAGYDEAGPTFLLVAVPDADPTAPWRLASTRFDRPTRFRITGEAFDGEQRIRQDADTLAIGTSLDMRGA
jgi:hypothetical protein